MTHAPAFIPSLTAAADATPAVMPAFGWDDVNPIKVLANLVALGATSVWQDIMTNIGRPGCGWPGSSSSSSTRSPPRTCPGAG